jgi:hypothetical protein
MYKENEIGKVVEMALIKDLKKMEKELMDQIFDLGERLKAVRLLLQNQVSTEFSVNNSPSVSLTTKFTRKKTIPSALKETIEKITDEWFTANVVTDLLIQSGIRTERQRESLRPTVSTILRRLSETGELYRKNVGTPDKPVYEYSKKDANRLL